MRPHTAEQHHIRFFTLQPLQHQIFNMMNALHDCATMTHHDAQHAVLNIIDQNTNLMFLFLEYGLFSW